MVLRYIPSLFILVNSTVFAQNLYEIILADFKEFPKPNLIKIQNIYNQNDTILFQHDGLKILITCGAFDSARIKIVEEDKNLIKAQLIISYSIWRNYFNAAYSCDIDHNGYNDILISYFPPGVSGLGANIPITTCLLFDKDIVYYQSLSSFGFDAEDSFYDFDGDKVFEFVCFSYHIDRSLKNPADQYFIKIFKIYDKIFKIFKDDNLAINRFYLIEQNQINKYQSVPDSLKKFMNFGPDLWKQK